MPDERGEAVNVRQFGVVLGIAATAIALAACGRPSKGPVTLNWYVFPEPSGSFAGGRGCVHEASGGRTQIEINILSTASDQQRVSLVRRLAAQDPSIDILAMDVDWTAEFATAKWIRPWTGADKAAVSSGRPPRPGPDGDLEGPALRGSDQLQHRAAWYRKDLVPTPAQDLDPDDRRRDQAGQGGQAALHRGTGRPSTRA